MYLKSRMLYLYVETPLHAGAGSGLGAVDLPIQRERATGYPIIQASGLKGALREKAPNNSEKLAVFGSDTSQENGNAGAFSPGDARILLFPVRSLKGVFAWITSLNALQRWQRESRDTGSTLPNLPTEQPDRVGDEVRCYAGDGVTTSDGFVVLEEFTFKRIDDPQNITKKITQWLGLHALPKNLDPYWGNLLEKNLVILPDDDFRDFLLHATEVLTRVRLEPDSKTVAQGALWTEEHLPADCLLYSPVRASRLRVDKSNFPNGWDKLVDDPIGQAEKVLDWVEQNVQTIIQLGGDETVGRGIVSLRWS